MPLKLSRPQDEIETVEVIGLKVPVFREFDDIPLGLRATFADLATAVARGAMSTGEMTLRLAEHVLRYSPDERDRLSYETLARLRLTEEEEAALSNAIHQATLPLWERMLERVRRKRDGGAGASEPEEQIQEAARGN